MAENAFLWSPTASDNDDADAAVPWPEGMLPGAVNNGARAMMAGVARLIKDLNGTISTTGSSNAYLLTSSSGHTALTNGILITAKASFTNTSAATLNLNSFGAKKIRVFINGAEDEIAPGQIVSGSTYQFRYDTALNSANGGFLLLNPTPNSTALAQTGDIKIWPSDTAPSGWVFCNGGIYAQINLPALYAIIGDTYAQGGEAAGTFRVPDLRGRAPFGSDDMGNVAALRITNAGSGIVGTALGAAGGAESVTLSTSQIPSHTHTGTTASGGSHTHTGTTGNQSADHTHSVIGTTATESVGHTHSGTTATESADHSHNVSGTSSGVSANHTHSGTTSSNGAHTHTTGQTGTLATGVDTLGGSSPVLGGGATTSSDGAHTHTITTGTESADHTHSINITSAGVSANHTHTFTTGDVSASHTHSISLTSGTVSANHTHSFTTDSGGSHTHTFTSDATGGGALHTNMPPALILNYIIKF